MVQEQNLTTGAKICGIIYYVSAGLGALTGLLMLLGGGLIGGAIQTFLPMELPAGIAIGAILGFVGVIMLIVAVIEFFIGKGLMNKQKWAWIVAIVFSILGFLGSLPSLFAAGTGIFGLVVNGVIIYFLLFDKPTKALYA